MDSSVAGPQTHFRENNPMHSRHAVERITFLSSQIASPSSRRATRLPVILRCEWRDAQHRAGSLEGWTARMRRHARIFPAGTAGLSPFEGR